MCYWPKCNPKQKAMNEQILGHSMKVKILSYVGMRVTWLRTVPCALFFLLNHFSHLSHSCSKTCHNSVFSLYFQTFWPKWLNYFQSFQKRFGVSLQKTACAKDLFIRHFVPTLFWWVQASYPLVAVKGLFLKFSIFFTCYVGLVSIHKQLFSVKHMEKVQ